MVWLTRLRYSCACVWTPSNSFHLELSWTSPREFVPTQGPVGSSLGPHKNCSRRAPKRVRACNYQTWQSILKIGADTLANVRVVTTQPYYKHSSISPASLGGGDLFLWAHLVSQPPSVPRRRSLTCELRGYTLLYVYLYVRSMVR